MQLDYERFLWATHLDYRRHPRSGRAMQKLTLVALTGHANARGECWPAITTIAEEIDEDRRDVRNAVEALVAAGHLLEVGRHGKTRKFVLGLHARAAVHTAAPGGGDSGGTTGGTTGGASGGMHRHYGKEANRKGTPQPPTASPRSEPMCEDHSTESARTCRSCRADVKAGERPAMFIGVRWPPAVAVGA